MKEFIQRKYEKGHFDGLVSAVNKYINDFDKELHELFTQEDSGKLEELKDDYLKHSDNAKTLRPVEMIMLSASHVASKEFGRKIVEEIVPEHFRNTDMNRIIEAIATGSENVSQYTKRKVLKLYNIMDERGMISGLFKAVIEGRREEKKVKEICKMIYYNMNNSIFKGWY